MCITLYCVICIKRVNPLTTGHTPVCGWRFQPADNITVHVVQMKYFFNFLSDSEASASELLENVSSLLVVVNEFKKKDCMNVFIIITCVEIDKDLVPVKSQKYPWLQIY